MSYIPHYAAGQTHNSIPYHYASGAPHGYMNQQPQQQQQPQPQQQQQRQPEQYIPSCGPSYTTPTYAHAPGQHHLPTPPVEMAPLGVRQQYNLQPQHVTPPPVGNLSYYAGPSSADARRENGYGSLTHQGEQRIPRTTHNNVVGELAAALQTNGSNNNNNNAFHGSPTDEPLPLFDQESIIHMIPPELYNQCVTQGDRLVLNDKASADDRLLFDIVKKYTRIRGKGMWDSITTEYYNSIGESVPSTPCLQMKYVRAMRKHFMLPHASYQLLMKLYEEDERNRFIRISKAFRESGAVGCEIKAAEVEAYLVRLGAECPLEDEASKIRRRRRNATVRRERRNGMADNEHKANMIWNRSYISAHDSAQPGFATSPFEFPPANATQAMTSEQEDRLMEDLESKYNGHRDGSSGRSPGPGPDPNTPGASPHEGHNPMLPSGADAVSQAPMVTPPTGLLSDIHPYNIMHTMAPMTVMPPATVDAHGGMKQEIWK